MFIKDNSLMIFIPSGCQSYKVSRERCLRQMISPFTSETEEAFDQLVVTGLNTTGRSNEGPVKTAGRMTHTARL